MLWFQAGSWEDRRGIFRSLHPSLSELWEGPHLLIDHQFPRLLSCAVFSVSTQARVIALAPRPPTLLSLFCSALKASVIGGDTHKCLERPAEESQLHPSPLPPPPGLCLMGAAAGQSSLPDSHYSQSSWLEFCSYFSSCISNQVSVLMAYLFNWLINANFKYFLMFPMLEIR